MKTIIFLFLALYLTLNLKAQDPTLVIKNETGYVLSLYITTYSTDSSKFQSGGIMVPNGDWSKLYSRQTDIRRDYIGLNYETKDTVFKMTVTEKDMAKGQIVFKKNINTLQLPYKTSPRLRIAENNFYKIFKINDEIEIKLKTKDKFSGIILSFHKESIKIKNDSGNVKKITPDQIKSIRQCGYLYAIAQYAFIKNCRYRKLDLKRFEIVEQKFNEKKKYMEWVQIE